MTRQTEIWEYPCIRRTYFGGTELVTMDEFERTIVQDEDEALSIVIRMLDGTDPYPFNEGAESCFYEEFYIFDNDELRRQVAIREESA